MKHECSAANQRVGYGFSYIGENIWWSTEWWLRENLEAVVQMWYNEKPYWNFYSLTCARGQQCGHYTAVSFVFIDTQTMRTFLRAGGVGDHMRDGLWRQLLRWYHQWPRHHARTYRCMQLRTRRQLAWTVCVYCRSKMHALSQWPL